MNREQMIAHLTIGGWHPARFHDTFMVLFRDGECCVYEVKKNEKSRHATSTWCLENNKEYHCEWEDIPEAFLIILYEIESGIAKGMTYEP